MASLVDAVAVALGAGAIGAIGYLSMQKQYHPNPVTGRLDLVRQQYPEVEVAVINYFVGRDPSGNLKYLEWEVKIFISGQAPISEIADVVELFHRYSGVRIETKKGTKQLLPSRDINTYKPADFTSLRDALRRYVTKRRRKELERLRRYKLEGECQSEIKYSSYEYLVRSILNKQASMHYGLGTKWCITMGEEQYYEEYDANNSVFFFLSRKFPRNDAYDRLAIKYDRDNNNTITRINYYNAIDQHISEVTVRYVYGSEINHIREVLFNDAQAQPKSLMARAMSGTATPDDILNMYNQIKSHKLSGQKLHNLLLPILVNYATPPEVLIDILINAQALTKIMASDKRNRVSKPYDEPDLRKYLDKQIKITIYNHPNTPIDVKQYLEMELRQRNVDTSTIDVDVDDGDIAIRYTRFRELQYRKVRRVKRRRYRVRHRRR